MIEQKQKISGREPLGFLILRAVAMPKDTNTNGDIFGGWIMSQMDMAGGMMAGEIAKGRTVTISVDKMIFKLPLHVGDTISIYGELIRIGNSSMDLKLEVWAKPISGEYQVKRNLVTEGLFRYVAIDEQGKPRRIADNPQFFSRPSNS